MPEAPFLYLVDGDGESRRELTGRLAERGIETWPFDTAAGFLQLLDKLRPSCVLLDMRIDGGRGSELIAALRERGKPWPVIALDAQPGVATAVAAMRAGAVDFLGKPADHELLDRALSAAWAWLRDGLQSIDDREDALARLDRLTRREGEVAAALLAGLSNKRVAHFLEISVRTVEMHRGNLMSKLGVRNMAEAAVLLARAGFSGTPAASDGTVSRRRGGPAGRRLAFAA
jgi:FixJ family two-component response regulator